MINFPSMLVALIPSLGMFSGLTASFTVALFLVSLIIKYKNYISFNWRKFKLEIAFFSWCLFCCLATPLPLKSLIILIEVSSLAGFGLLLKDSNILERSDRLNIYKNLAIGISIAVVIFFIEYLSQGFAYRNFRSLFQANSQDQFILPTLDRGCAILALSAWVLIAILLNKKKTVLSIILYLIVWSILYMSDSLASFVGFTLAGLIVIISYILPIKIFKFLTIMVFIGSTALPIIVNKIDPQYISQRFDELLPDSAKHRLFIWHFVSEKAKIELVKGWGFSASKQYKVSENEMVNFKNYIWSPLPLHPHNNILQILFEIGGIGLILFLLLVYKYLNKIEEIIKINFTLGSISYACFINYYIIGMISFSVWQAWWVAIGVWISLLFSNLISSNDSKQHLKVLANN